MVLSLACNPSCWTSFKMIFLTKILGDHVDFHMVTAATRVVTPGESFNCWQGLHG
jgi:hypothetical protein